MKKIKHIVLLLFLVNFSKTYAQIEGRKQGQETVESHNGENYQHSKEKSTKAVAKPVGNTNSTKAERVETVGSFQLNENDMYQGRKDEFLAQITLKALPSDFPKYEKWMGVKGYNQIIDEYYKKHLDILIPSLKQKLSR